uniref:Uncharacterized protein n=1 Tax=Trichuris muris TaxID=70415 RepID=A0A5S6Q8N6_TRIMR
MTDNETDIEAARETGTDDTRKAYLDLETSIRDVLISVDEHQALIKDYHRQLEQYATEIKRYSEMQRKVNDAAKTLKALFLTRKELLRSLIKENSLLSESETAVSRQLNCLNAEEKESVKHSDETGERATEKLLVYWQLHYDALEWTRDYKSAFEMHEGMLKEVNGMEKDIADLSATVASFDGVLEGGSKFDGWKIACCKLANVAVKNKKLEQEIDLLRAQQQNDDEDFLYDPNSISTQEIPRLFKNLQNAADTANKCSMRENDHPSPLRSFGAIPDYSGLANGSSPTRTPEQIVAVPKGRPPAKESQFSNMYTPSRTVELKGTAAYSPSPKRRALEVNQEPAQKSSTKGISSPTGTYVKMQSYRPPSAAAKRTADVFSTESTQSMLSMDGGGLMAENPYFREVESLRSVGGELLADAFVPPRARAPQKLSTGGLPAGRFNAPNVDDSQSPLNFVMNLMQSPLSDSAAPSRGAQGKSVAFGQAFTEGANVENFARRFGRC